MAKFCSHCGKKVKEESCFCDGCGNSLSETHPQTQARKWNICDLIISTYSLPLTANGVLAATLGIVNMIVRATTTVYGFRRTTDAFYDHAVETWYGAASLAAFLCVLGCILIAVGVTMSVIKRREKNPILNKVLWLVPLAVTVILTFVSFSPLSTILEVQSH